MRTFWVYLLLIFGLSLESLATLYSQISDFERKAVDKGMALFGLMPELSPDNKIIDQIYVLTEPPFSERSGFLAFFDRLHIDTKTSVIRRYLFFSEGDFYSSEAVKDSELYLRRLENVRSLAVIVPVRSKAQAKDRVDLLVVTRDLLSLSPAFSFAANGTTLTDLTAAFGENNLLGYNKSISAAYDYKQALHLLSLRYFDPSFLGTRYELMLKPGLILERNTLQFDGYVGEFEFKRPLLSRSDKWGFGIDGQFGSKPVIDFSGKQIRTFAFPELPSASPVERMYRWRYAQGKAQVRRSFGFNKKKEVYAGYGLNVKRPSIPDSLHLTELEQESFKRHVLPRNEIESYISLGAAYFEDRYMTLYDYNNFKLQETKRIGPMITVANDFSSLILGSDTNFLRPEVKISFMQPLMTESFFSMSFFSSNRYDGAWSNNTLKASFGFVSPTAPKIGRLVLESSIASALNSRDNQKYVLGAESSLRGVPSRFYLGSQGFRTNVEFRGAPFELWIVHVGGVLFYDVGGAFEHWERANLTQSLGFGLRILAPQISSQLFRIDLGFPIYGRGKDYNVVVPSFGIGQAF